MDQKELVKLAATTAAKTALKAWEEQRKKYVDDLYDTRLRNIRLLLKNYRAFKSAAAEAVFNAGQIEKENANEILKAMMEGRDEPITVQSIQRSAARTAVMVAHIDKMLSLYHIYCEKSVKPEMVRRYDVIRLLYIDDPPRMMEEVADMLCISRSTAYGDRDGALEDMAALVFGVDSVMLEI